MAYRSAWVQRAGTGTSPYHASAEGTAQGHVPYSDLVITLILGWGTLLGF